jgi:type IV secretory pathway protease TraF
MHPEASDDTQAHGARQRPAWTTRPGGRAPRVRRRALPGGDTPTPRAPGTRSSVVLGGLLVVAMVSTRWVRLNLSPSRPPGLYRLTALRAPRTRGMVVVLPVPACVRPWQAAWVPRRKPIAGVAGDVVCHTDHTLYVKGTDFGVVYPTAHGQSLPPIPKGGLVVPEEPVFLASTAPTTLSGSFGGRGDRDGQPPGLLDLDDCREARRRARSTPRATAALGSDDGRSLETEEHHDETC